MLKPSEIGPVLETSDVRQLATAVAGERVSSRLFGKWKPLVGSFHTPPVRLLRGLCSSSEWYESLVGDHPPAKGFEERARKGGFTGFYILPPSINCPAKGFVHLYCKYCPTVDDFGQYPTATWKAK